MAEDRKRGAVDRINSAVDTARNIKTAVSLARAAGTAAEAVATSETWVPILIVILVVLVIIILFVVIIIATTGGTGSANPAPTPLPLPSSTQDNCPIPNGVVTCGSKNIPINGCGHCGLNYPHPEYCNYPGIYYAMDVAPADTASKSIYLPKINGDVIKWTFAPPEIIGYSGQAIQTYTGVDELTHEQYLIGFHHTQPRRGNQGDHFSGEIGARICDNGCDHVHVEFALGSSDWKDAPLYFGCRR